MATTFIIGDTGKTYEISNENSMLDLKNEIIKQFKIDVKYIDLEFLNEKPIRGFGKMNLEPGILPRTMDKFPLSRYNLEGKEIKCKFVPVEDYLPDIMPKNGNPSSLYVPPAMKKNNNNVEKRYVEKFDLNSMTDFPAL